MALERWGFVFGCGEESRTESPESYPDTPGTFHRRSCPEPDIALKGRSARSDCIARVDCAIANPSKRISVNRIASKHHFCADTVVLCLLFHSAGRKDSSPGAHPQSLTSALPSGEEYGDGHWVADPTFSGQYAAWRPESANLTQTTQRKASKHEQQRQQHGSSILLQPLRYFTPRKLSAGANAASRRSDLLQDRSRGLRFRLDSRSLPGSRGFRAPRDSSAQTGSRSRNKVQLHWAGMFLVTPCTYVTSRHNVLQVRAGR